MVSRMFFKIALFYVIIVVLYHFNLMKDLSYKSEFAKNKFSMLYHIFLVMFFPIILFLALVFTYMAYLEFGYIIGSLIKFFK